MDIIGRFFNTEASRAKKVDVKSSEDRFHLDSAPAASRLSNLTGVSPTTMSFLNATERTVSDLTERCHYFGIDATGSRRKTWAAATQAQIKRAKLFAESGETPPLIRVAFYSGQDTFRRTSWTRDTKKLATWMSDVSCEGGVTQIQRLFEDLATQITKEKKRVKAADFVFDHMDGDMKDNLVNLALGIGKTTPINIWHEVENPDRLDGNESTAQEAFLAITAATGGTYKHFRAGQYADLEGYIAVSVAAASGEKSELLARLKRNPHLLSPNARDLLLSLSRS